MTRGREPGSDVALEVAADLALEVALRDLGASLDVPPVPDLARAVTARIAAERPRRAATGGAVGAIRSWAGLGRRPGARRRSLVLALAALLVAAAAVAAGAGYGLPGLRILFGPVATPSMPAATPTPGPSSASTAPGATLGLGTPVTLEQARGLVDFPVLLPGDPTLGTPDAAYLAGRRLTLVWGAGPGRPGTTADGVGLLLVEVHARVDEAVISKLVDAGTTVERVTVDGADGYWIHGAVHELAYLAPDGTPIRDSVRLAGSTLVWTRDGVTYRLEGELPRDAAIALAAALR